MTAELFVSGASVACAVLLVCMLQVEFRRSSHAFRWSVTALAGTLLVHALAPVMAVDGQEIVDAAMHAALLAVLGLVRWRQLRTGRCGAR